MVKCRCPAASVSAGLSLDVFDFMRQATNWNLPKWYSIEASAELTGHYSKIRDYSYTTHATNTTTMVSGYHSFTVGFVFGVKSNFHFKFKDK
jgi:hypothetical protein